jgi:hypothetical protein
MNSIHEEGNVHGLRSSRTIILAVVAASVVAVGSLSAQSSCAPSDDAAINFRDFAIQVVTATDSAGSAERDSLRLPMASASQVQVISDSRTCRTAGDKLFAAFPVLAATPAAVRVLKINTVYIVEGPPAVNMERRVLAVYDLKWNFKHRFIR